MMSSEASKYLKSVLVLTSLLALTQCHFEDENNEPVDQSQNDQNHEFPEGIGRLLFKHMRFRDVEDIPESEQNEYTSQLYRPWQDRKSGERNQNSGHNGYVRESRSKDHQTQLLKRERQRTLVNNLAALLSDIKGRDTGSTLRMPSLRFG